MLDRILIGSSAEPTDPYFANVSLLLHGDGSNGAQNNTFLDSSTNNLTVTRNGNATQGSFSKFTTKPYSASANGGSVYLDGSGDYLSVPYTTANFDWFTSGVDFTIEFWFYVNSTTGTSYLDGGINHPTAIGNRDPAADTDYWSFGPTSANTVTFYYFASGARSVTSSATYSTGTWNHVAMTKTSSGITIFVNGVAGTTTAIVSSPSSSTGVNLVVGQGNGTSFNGYISNLRIVRGTAIYSGNFTPPTAPVTAVTNTKLLLNATNAAIFDNSMKNDLETVGNAQISTSVKKFGTGSMYFDGTGDFITMPSTSDLSFGSGNFTIEGWVYRVGGGSDQVICDFRSGTGTTIKPCIFINSSNQLIYLVNGSAVIVGGTIAATTWTHVALSKSGSSTKMFINGTQTGSTYTDTNDYGATSRCYLGADDDGGQNAFLNGYIDDLRVTKGIARYTANFTAPTAAFPNK